MKFSARMRERMMMKNTLRDWLVLGAVVSTASFVMACGGGKDDEESSEPSGGSFDAAMSAIESPTGTLDETTAADVAMAFEQSMASATGGERENAAPVEAQTTELTGVCDSGTITFEGSQSGDVTYNYNDCCITGCCIDGNGTAFVDTTGTATYSVCATFDLTYACEGTNANVSYSYCQGAAGLVYAVEVNGDTFAVTGSIVNGTGTLEITGENGTFSCTYTDYTGSCTDSTGGSFSF